MNLLVLAGGFGTRLQSVVSQVPKALAPVVGVPFLHLQIEHWKSQGIRSFGFLLHHQAELIIGFLQSNEFPSVTLKVKPVEPAAVKEEKTTVIMPIVTEEKKDPVKPELKPEPKPELKQPEIRQPERKEEKPATLPR